MRLLLAEDDQLLGDAERKTLIRAGYAVDWVQSRQDFECAIEGHHYDIVVLDLSFPDGSGEMMLAHLHHKLPRIPVIVVSARASSQDKVSLLNMGADDFLAKPFDLDELTARVCSITRRQPTDNADEGATRHGPLTLCPMKFSATLHDVVVILTHREFRVLETLVKRKNQVVTRAQIEESLYGWGEEVESNAVEVYVHMLRRKLSAKLIHTIRGVGYQLAEAHQITPSDKATGPRQMINMGRRTSDTAWQATPA